ncbi:hypothetical protein K469DRAFT_790149, partial [Zopfia rhizophila CBS 207.26]
YDNPKALSPAQLSFEAIAIICITLRFYSRHWMQKLILNSDWLVFSAFVCGTATTILEIYREFPFHMQNPPNFALHSCFEDPTATTRHLNAMKRVYLFEKDLALSVIEISVSFLYRLFFGMVVFRRFLTVWIILSLGQRHIR